MLTVIKWSFDQLRWWALMSGECRDCAESTVDILREYGALHLAVIVTASSLEAVEAACAAVPPPEELDAGERGELASLSEADRLAIESDHDEIAVFDFTV